MTKKIDMLGARFGKITVTGSLPTVNGKSMWSCLCSCGTQFHARGESLRSGNTKSCGCLQPERASATAKTHGMSRTKAHRIWCGMLTRCRNENHHSFKRYGALGITVSDDWLVFENFLADMGEPKRGMSLDRIDNNGGYNKENCRWANVSTQARNKGNNKRICFNGESKCLIDWAESTGIKFDTLKSRFLRGWGIERALTTPTRTR